MKNPFFRALWIFCVLTAVVLLSCKQAPDGQHAWTALQFDKGASYTTSNEKRFEFTDSDFVSLINSPALLMKAMQKTGQEPTEENLLSITENFKIDKNKNSGVYFIKFYNSNRELAVRFLDTFLVELTREIKEKQTRSVNQQLAVIDSAIRKSAGLLDSIERQLTAFKKGNALNDQDLFESLRRGIDDSSLEKLKKIPLTQREYKEMERKYAVNEHLLSFLVEKKTELSISSAGMRARLAILKKPVYVQR